MKFNKLNETYWINNKEIMDQVSKLGKELEADGFKFYSDRYSGSTYYDFYTKRGDNGAICKAVQYSYEGAQIIDITIDQLIGKEPIDNFETLRRKLGKMLLPKNEAMNEDKEDKFVLYFPYLEPKIISKDRAIKQMELELNEFKNNSGASVAGRGFGIYCLQSYDPDTDSVWTGRYSSKEFLNVLHEDVKNESFEMATGGDDFDGEIAAMRAEQQAFENVFEDDAKKILEYAAKHKHEIKRFSSLEEYLDELNLNGIFDIPSKAPGFKCQDYYNVTEKEAAQYINLLLQNTNLRDQLNQYMNETQISSNRQITFTPVEETDECPYLQGVDDSEGYDDYIDRYDLTEDELWQVGWIGSVQNVEDGPFNSFDELEIYCYDKEKGKEYDLPQIPEDIKLRFVAEVNKYIELLSLDENKTLTENVSDGAIDYHSLYKELNQFFKKEGNAYWGLDVAYMYGKPYLYCYIENGDWKHDHLAIEHYMDKYFDAHPTLYIKKRWRSNYKGSDGDWYSEEHWWEIDSSEVTDEDEEPLYLTLQNIDDTYTD